METSLQTSHDLQQRLTELSLFMESGRDFWANSALFRWSLPWEAAYPGLADGLRALPLARIEELEASPGACAQAPDPYNSLWRRSLELSEVPRLRFEAPGRLSKWAHVGIRGRKWAQIQAFVGTVWAQNPRDCGRIFDWCGGKGHLGRTLAQVFGKSLRVVDRDPALCRAAGELAERAGVSCEAVVRDAAEPGAGALLDEAPLAVALHACGCLGSRFLAHAAEQRVPFLATAGCCYHRIVGRDFVPLSERGRRADLRLDRELMRLATTEVVAPTAANRSVRRRTSTFRAGLQILAADLGWSREPLSVGYVPSNLFRLEFPAFCQAVAARWGTELPAPVDAARIIPRARERARCTRALDLVRYIFRRPLELWLVLDRALFLAEQGRSVCLGTFCARSVTPRNLMLCSALESSNFPSAAS